jgi:hypothetical protein
MVAITKTGFSHVITTIYWPSVYIMKMWKKIISVERNQTYWLRGYARRPGLGR